MGEIRATVRLENDLDRGLYEVGKLAKGKIRSATISAVVDTGAVMTLLPKDIVKKLGLRSMGKTVVTLADESQIVMECAGTLSLTVAGRQMKTDCLVGPKDCEPLLGQLVMERLDLIADPARKKLEPRPESPDLPTLKMKRGSFGFATSSIKGVLKFRSSHDNYPRLLEQLHA